MDIEKTLECLSQNISLLRKNLGSSSEYSENESSIKFVASIRDLVDKKVSKSVVCFFINCYWLAKNKIDPDLRIYLREPIIIARLDLSGNLNIDQNVYNDYLWDRNEECPEVDNIYQKILNKQIQKRAIGKKGDQIDIDQKIFELFTDMLIEIYSNCGDGFNLKIQVTIKKQDIEKALLDKISQPKEYIRLGFWLEKEEFLKFLSSDKVRRTMKYLSDGEKIPLIIIPDSKLKLRSKFFHILPSWTEISQLETSELRAHHEALKDQYDLIKSFPPSILLQDEILKHKVVDSCWKLIVQSIFHMISDRYMEDKQRRKFEFQFRFGFKKKTVCLESERDKSLLRMPRDRHLRKYILSSLKDFNDKYVDSLKTRSLKKGWKIAFNEILGLNMGNLLEGDNIQKIIDLYDKLVVKAFDEELDKLTNLVITVEKSTLDITDQIARTINSISSEVHNSTMAVFGALLVQIVAIISKETDLIWLLGALLVLLLIVFYIPMVNRKIIGFMTTLSDTRNAYEKTIENSFEILGLPESGSFLKVKTFYKNVEDRWSRFETTVKSEIGFLRFVSISLYAILMFLAFIKPKSFDTIPDFFAIKTKSSDNLLDFFVVLTPIIALMCMLLWKRYVENSLKECFVYGSRRVLLLSFFFALGFYCYMVDVSLILLSILLWIIAILISWFIVVEVILRIIRRFVHFPIPAVLTRIIDNPIRRRIQPPAKVIDWIGIQNGMHVLEIGPGTGTFTIEAANRVGKGMVCAVDIQPSVVLILNRNLCKAGVTNVIPCVASAYELPFSDNIFDRVFMASVLAEIPDREKALREIKRVLKDDGLLAIDEFLTDPDYPRRKTVTTWCKSVGFELAGTYGGILHYVLTFKK